MTKYLRHTYKLNIGRTTCTTERSSQQKNIIITVNTHGRIKGNKHFFYISPVLNLNKETSTLSRSNVDILRISLDDLTVSMTCETDSVNDGIVQLYCHAKAFNHK